MQGPSSSRVTPCAWHDGGGVDNDGDEEDNEEGGEKSRHMSPLAPRLIGSAPLTPLSSLSGRMRQ
eukprot:2609228-Pyramimonas_sp.AAC.1